MSGREQMRRQMWSFITGARLRGVCSVFLERTYTGEVLRLSSWPMAYPLSCYGITRGRVYLR